MESGHTTGMPDGKVDMEDSYAERSTNRRSVWLAG